MVYSTFRLCKINIKSVTEMRNIIRMVGIGVAALCMVTPTVQAQVKLNANNIDEVIGEMTLEEKVHMVIGWYVNGRWRQVSRNSRTDI